MSADPFNVFDPRIKRHMQILYPSSFEVFESLVYEDIDLAVRNFTSSLSTHRKEYHEDEISRSICIFLKGRSYQANNGVYCNGETDICVKDDSGKYEVICESKKFDMNKLTDGAYQLITRYSRGTNDQSGIIFIYIGDDLSVRECVDVWCQYTIQQSAIDQENLSDLKFLDCPNNRDCKISLHTHPISGHPFKIRHIPVSYYFNPQEKTRPKQGKDGKKDALAALEKAQEEKISNADNEKTEIE